MVSPYMDYHKDFLCTLNKASHQENGFGFFKKVEANLVWQEYEKLNPVMHQIWKKNADIANNTWSTGSYK